MSFFTASAYPSERIEVTGNSGVLASGGIFSASSLAINSNLHQEFSSLAGMDPSPHLQVRAFSPASQLPAAVSGRPSVTLLLCVGI